MSVYCQLVDGANPQAGGPSVAFDPVPVVGDFIKHPRIRGVVAMRQFICEEGNDNTSQLHYIKLHIRVL